ncbi:hypothetical protein AAKU67_001691 [Oxalobacteraceae bacterium GrIS 2.11]
MAYDAVRSVRPSLTAIKSAATSLAAKKCVLSGAKRTDFDEE